MKKCMIAAAMISMATHAAADTVGDAQQLLEMWAPVNITLSDNTLTVVLPQRRITTEIYLAVIQTGICFAPLYGMDMQKVEQIEILNQFSAQGFVYEKGIEDCEAYNILPANDKSTEIQILGNTHGYP